jgi:2,5-furandicarboxylate decarboxylase 1
LPKDLRSFLDDIKRRGSDWYVEVEKEVDPKYEPVALMRKLQFEGRSPTVMFEKVRGFEMPVVSWVASNFSHLAAAFDTTEDGLIAEYSKREQNMIPPRHVSDGPVKEVITKGDAVDLRKLPILTSCEKDSGPYITIGVTLVKDPETGYVNAGVYRHLIHEKNVLGLGGPEPHSRLSRIMQKAEKSNKPLDAAIFIGHHPAAILASQAKRWVDETEVMSGLLGEPIDLVRAQTVDLEVPAWAEIVIEGKIPPSVRKTDGPFAEFTFYYGAPYESAIFSVTAITHRRDAIYQHVNPMFPEHNIWGILPREANLLRKLSATVPTVKEVKLPLAGCGRFICYVKIEKTYEGQGKIAAAAALSADPFVKIVVVVDEDVNIKDNNEVLWAIATRTQLDNSLFQIPGAPGSVLDPSNYSMNARVGGGNLNTKLAIDATKPFGIRYPERVEVPKDLLETINLQEYLPSAR